MDEKQLQHARASWCNRGKNRPDFALTPGAGQESVWDYPRPPVIVDDTRRVRVKVGNVVLADSCEAIRVLETASPPTFYLPPCDIRMELFSTGSGQSFCEWKGHAEYLDYCVGGQCIANIAWYYPAPFDAMSELKDYLAFYPSRAECYVNDQRVRAQAGGFYGGWITDDIVGPFKGEPGTSGW